MKSRLRRVVIFCLVSVVISSLFSACTAPTDKTVSYPIEIIDQLGRTVKLDRIPQRIISLAPSNTEILFALGLADRVVAVTDYCNYPKAAQEKPKVGGFSTVDIERVVEIQPDLILAANIHQEEVIPALERFDLTVVCLDPTNLEEVLEAIMLAGQYTGEEDKASQLVTDMMSRIELITNKTANLTDAQKPRVFSIMWHDPLMAVGRGLRHDLILQAGGINIVEELGEEYPSVSLEWVIDKNPEVIIAGVGMGTGEDLTFQFALNEDRLAGVDARLNNRVYQIDLDLIGRSGPRIVQGFEIVAKMIHPEIFGEIE